MLATVPPSPWSAWPFSHSDHCSFATLVASGSLRSRGCGNGSGCCCGSSPLQALALSTPWLLPDNKCCSGSGCCGAVSSSCHGSPLPSHSHWCWSSTSQSMPSLLQPSACGCQLSSLSLLQPINTSTVSAELVPCPAVHVQRVGDAPERRAGSPGLRAGAAFCASVPSVWPMTVLFVRALGQP